MCLVAGRALCRAGSKTSNRLCNFRRMRTEIGLTADALSGSLTLLRNASLNARCFAFRWRQRTCYMSRMHGLGDLLDASAASLELDALFLMQ